MSTKEEKPDCNVPEDTEATICNTFDASMELGPSAVKLEESERISEEANPFSRMSED